MIYPEVIRVHCGNGYVRGKAKQYSYYVAQLFRLKSTMDDRLIYESTGIFRGPFRSKEKTEREGEQWARELGIPFIEGYGSLHLQPPEVYLPRQNLELKRQLRMIELSD
jgi:hypothetical protein